MSVRRHHPTIALPPPPYSEELAAAEAQARLSRLQSNEGDSYCSSRGCSAQTGLECAFVDRRDRHCPTAWCPEHRLVTRGAIYCPAHAALADGTSTAFSEMAHPDLENQAPALVNWVAREMHEDISNVAEAIAQQLGETLVVDPVRFVLFGVERIRTWDRSWKTVTILGHSLRVAVAVEEAKPKSVLGKVNSHTVVRLPAPFHPDHMIGDEPASAEQAEENIAEFHHGLFFGIARAVDAWREMQLVERDSTIQAAYHPNPVT